MKMAGQWKPFKDMDELQHRLLHLMGGEDRNGPEEPHGGWHPLADIIEEEHEYLIKLELPEVRREDLSVAVEQGVLTVSGERRSELRPETRRLHRLERSYGRFARSFSLPEGTDPAQIRAEFRDGVLRLNVTKPEKQDPKTIPIGKG